MEIEILRDNREQKPWEFDSQDAVTRDVTLNTGDYTLAEFCQHDSDLDTYYPSYAIERKEGGDFVNSITNNRERFLEEIQRASDWDSEMLVFIEEPKRTFKRQQGFMRFRDISWKTVSSTVDSWERAYNVSFRFAGSRERAQRIAYDTLFSRLQTVLTSE